jgi:hypothetical protein
VAPFIAQGLQEVLQYFHELQPNSSPAPDFWCQAVCAFEHIGNVDSADRWYASVDVVNITNGAVDSSWTTTDHNTVASGVDVLVNAYLAHAPNSLHYIGQNHYMRSFTPVPGSALPPGQADKPFQPTGPPVATYTRNLAGLAPGNAGIPPQNAVSITEITSYPRHWGRMYLPQLEPASYASDGHILSSVVDAIATGASSSYGQLQAAEFFPVVPVVQINKAPARGLLQVTNIQVDDNPDIIRRRRPATTTHRKRIP